MDDAYSWQAKYLAITPKPFAILSICGSVCIIKHILSSPKRLVKTSTFARILFALSIFDVMTSCGVFMGTWPIPRGTPGVYMASGNKGTCTGKNYYIICNICYPFMNITQYDSSLAAQGFWMQLGIGVPLYNASLSIYYFLVLFKGYKEHQVKKVEPLFHGVPIIFALSTAIAVAATDNYRSANVWCWITMDNNAMRLGFFNVPVWSSILLVTASMSAIYCRFLIQERKTKKYSDAEERLRSQTQRSQPERGQPQQIQTDQSIAMSDLEVGTRLQTANKLQSTNRLQSTRNNNHLQSTVNTISSTVHSTARKSHSKKIASQALWYVGSFYLTWIGQSWTRISQIVNGSSPFYAIALFAIFFPLQGFFNALVYFRPRYLRLRETSDNRCSVFMEMFTSK